MKQIITLNEVCKDFKIIDEPLVCPEPLSLAFSCKYSNLSFVITIKNGDNKESFFRQELQELTIPEEFMLGGLLEISVEGLCRGEAVKHWEALPIIVKHLDGKFEIADKLSELEERIKALEDIHKPIL